MRGKSGWILVLTLAMFVAAAPSVGAQNSGKILFSFYVSQPGYDGTTAVTLTFRLYDSPTGGTPVGNYSDQQSLLITSDTSFAAVLGDGSGGPVSAGYLASNPNLYVAAEDAGTEIGPRTPLYSYGFSHYAEMALTATAAQTATSAQTAAQAQTFNPGAFVSGTLAGSMLGLSNNGSGDALFARATGSGNAGYFEVFSTNNSNSAVHASTISNTGRAGFFQIASLTNTRPALHATTSGTGTGVLGESRSTSVSEAGVVGLNLATTGYGIGVRGETRNPNQGAGVYGINTASTGTAPGVIGITFSREASGIFGWHLANSGTQPGVEGGTDSLTANAAGVIGRVNATNPGTSSAAVRGINNGTGGLGIGVWGSHNGSGWGVFGSSVAGPGVIGQTNNANGTGVVAISAGSLPGNLGLQVWGRAQISGTLSKGGGSFKIDHPLDPENKYLYHSFVESPDMKNVYDGVAALDANGEAWVNLPEYFEALNRDYRYQLTAVGTPGPGLYIAEEISSNRFKIAGGLPNGKVSWQVTGIRKDPFAEKYRIPVEEEKPAPEKGYYLHPDAYGQPETKGVPHGPQFMEVGSQPN